MNELMSHAVSNQHSAEAQPQNKTSTFNSIARSRVGRAVLLAAGAAVALKYLPGLSGAHNQVESKKVHVQGHVTALDGIVIDCRARMTSEVKATVPTSVDSPLGKLPYSGFTFQLRNGKAEENSAATTETTTCLPDAGINITYPDNKHEVVHIDQSGIKLSTRYVEDKSTVYTDSKPLALAGEALGGALKFITGGHVDTYMPYDQRLKAEGESFTRQVGVDNVEGQCAVQAYDLTKQVIETAYAQEAVTKHIDPKAVSVVWTGSEPTFTPPYNLELNDGKFHAHAKDFAVNNCVIDGDVLAQVGHDAHIYQAPLLAEIK